MFDLVDGHFNLIGHKVDISLSLSVLVSFRVNTLHRVTAGVNISVALMALQVRFAKTHLRLCVFS